ncbi:MAG TPA: hypothetical protein VHS33_00080 [Sphingomicrobium sp.]|jgi:hypothetical protein|nr:hypothetical protein [Sphingomicrobium sp.]
MPEHITPEEAADRVSKCGLGPVTVDHRQTDWGEDEEVLVAAMALDATDEQLASADRAATVYLLELPATLQHRYDAIRGARIAAELLDQSRARLASCGLLERVPPYQAGVTDDEAFTRAVEELCGPRAKGAFGSKHGFHAISPDWVRRKLNVARDHGEPLTRILDVVRVARYEVHFVGNMWPHQPNSS